MFQWVCGCGVITACICRLVHWVDFRHAPAKLRQFWWLGPKSRSKSYEQTFVLPPKGCSGSAVFFSVITKKAGAPLTSVGADYHPGRAGSVLEDGRRGARGPVRRWLPGAREGLHPPLDGVSLLVSGMKVLTRSHHTPHHTRRTITFGWIACFQVENLILKALMAQKVQSVWAGLCIDLTYHTKPVWTKWITPIQVVLLAAPARHFPMHTRLFSKVEGKIFSWKMIFPLEARSDSRMIRNPVPYRVSRSARSAGATWRSSPTGAARTSRWRAPRVAFTHWFVDPIPSKHHNQN